MPPARPASYRTAVVVRVVVVRVGVLTCCNVGLTGDVLLELIEDHRERDINITTLGFGMGNYNDTQMEQIADRGNGNYARFDDVINLATGAANPDQPDMDEFIELVATARDLWGTDGR